MSENPVTPEIQKSNDLLPVYFQPGQLIFHAHGNWSNQPDKIKKLTEWANEVANSEWENKIAGSINISVSDDIDSVFDFNTLDNLNQRKQSSRYERRENILRKLAEQTEGHYKPPPLKIPPPFSLVFTDVKSENWRDIEDYSKDITDEKAEERAYELKKILLDTLDLAIRLDERRNDAPVQLEVVSPNWLMSGSRDDPGGTGGPGGRPSPVDISDIGNYHIFPNLNQISKKSLPLFKDASKPDAGNEVVVAILDTSYSKDQLEEIHNTWVLARNEPHPIVRSLLGDSGALRDASGQLHVYTDPAVDNYLPGLTIDCHDYNMTDHGLFVAGIINLLAPKAELHLYQVLNKYGLGDLRSIARALQQVFNNFQERKLVVNLSLTMDMPLDERQLNTRDVLNVGREIRERSIPFERQAKIFEWIIDLVYSLDSRVIAAAGNESNSVIQRLPALYPAAFDRVLGVGALAYDGDTVVPASYSNLADKPTNNGITTFGGEAGGKKKEILGVYVGEFPDENGNKPTNENGWAWWSGTSFATPIISGITAAVLSKMPGAITEEAIIKVFEAQTKNTGNNEDVFTVVQGPPRNSP